MTWGITDNGFVAPTFEELRERNEQRLISLFGPLDLTPESTAGQQVGLWSTGEYELWLALQAIYNATRPATATGFSLDGIAAYTGTLRLVATASEVDVTIVGTPFTNLIPGVEIGGTGVESNFALIDEFTFSADSCLAISIEVLNNTEAAYTIVINSISYEYVPFLTDTIDTIITDLVVILNANTQGFNAVEDYDNNLINITFPALSAVTISAGMSISNVTNIVRFKASTLGSIPAPALSLDEIVTPVLGWISCVNEIAADLGRDLESDTALRLRREQSVRTAGAGTPEAIRAGLLNVTGVISASVTENETLVTDPEGRPPKSFECLVLGGIDDDIAQAIWDKKPAGIESYGNVTINILDSNEVTQAISFSRPVTLYIFVEVNITLDGTPAFPLDGEDIIKQGIVDQINAYAIGQDVIYQSLFASVYSVGGIESATIAIGGTANELIPPTTSSANIDLLSNEIARTDLTKITINIS